jgi:hypothetical protein
MNFSDSTSSHISERLSALGLTRHSFVLCTKCAMWDYFGVSRTEASQSRLRGQRVSTHESFLTGGANVQIQTQVYISERLSALRLIRHSFVLYRKSASVVWKMWVLYINYPLIREAMCDYFGVSGTIFYSIVSISLGKESNSKFKSLHPYHSILISEYQS